jgi:hypothetical protein
VGPYLPFSARVCLNQHHWLAKRLLSEGIDFKQCSNAFLKCSDPAKLQNLAESLTAQDLLSCGQIWLACLTPFFKESERKEAGCQHRLFFSQVEYCDNLIFHRRAALDQLGQRLLDANRTIGQPKKITMIFGRKVTKQYKGKLQTVREDLELPNPVIRSHYGKGPEGQLSVLYSPLAKRPLHALLCHVGAVPDKCWSRISPEVKQIEACSRIPRSRYDFKIAGAAEIALKERGDTEWDWRAKSDR